MEEGQTRRGVLGWIQGFLFEDRVTWADRLAERMKAERLNAWEDRQLALYEEKQSSGR